MAVLATKDHVKKEDHMLRTPCCDVQRNENQADIKTMQRRQLLSGEMKAKLTKKFLLEMNLVHGKRK